MSHRHQQNSVGLIPGLETQAAQIRADILKMIHAAQSGHPGGSLSATDIVTYLYFYKMRIDPKRPKWEERDRFILSKGHACPVLYACLARRGFFPVEELFTLREINSRLQGHPDMTKTPGVDFTTGSLGQGLSIGEGMALTLKAMKRKAKVYVMLGDGELNEGQIWEAALSVAKFKLENLVVIVDYNDLQLDGWCHDVMPLEPLKAKWMAFNWHTLEINGHDFSEIIDAFKQIDHFDDGYPTAIIAHTIKGKGVSFMENECNWHGKAPSDKELDVALSELGFEQTLRDVSHKTSLKTKDSMRNKDRVRRIPTREAFGEVIVELAQEFPELVVLEADISKSTKTHHFATRYPDRFYQFGVAEANMMVAAAGMAASGKIPIVSTYAVFASMRACEQVRTFIAYPKMNVKICVSHGGLTPANDGVTHQGTEDMGILRTIPGMAVIMPADFYSTKKLVRAALRYNGPVYLRFTRDPVPILYDSDESFEIGKGKCLRSGNDVSLLALGDMVSIALKASEALEKTGISTAVYDFHTIKPIDEALILEAARQTGRIVTVEDHQIQGGLGSAVAEVLSESYPTPLRRIGLRNTFAESGEYDLLLEKYEMGVDAIVRAAQELITLDDKQYVR